VTKNVSDGVEKDVKSKVLEKPCVVSVVSELKSFLDFFFVPKFES
jgi:hypothetical protein